MSPTPSGLGRCSQSLMRCSQALDPDGSGPFQSPSRRLFTRPRHEPVHQVLEIKVTPVRRSYVLERHVTALEGPGDAILPVHGFGVDKRAHVTEDAPCPPIGPRIVAGKHLGLCRERWVWPHDVDLWPRLMRDSTADALLVLQISAGMSLLFGKDLHEES